MRSRVGILVIAAMLAASAARAELRPGSAIEDRGGLFSPSAIAEGNRIVEEIQRGTRPPKQVAVVTVPKIAGGGSPRDAAEELFRERSLDGVLVFAVKEPGRLEIVAGRRTEARFTPADRDEMLRVMLERFKRKQFDEGLTTGLGLARDKLLAAFPSTGENPAPRGVPHDVATEQPTSGLPGWAWLLLLAGGAWFLISMARRNQRSSGTDMPVSGGYPPSAGYGGGGFGRSLLGGLFGAMAGQWLYDRWSGGGESWGRDDSGVRGDSSSDWSDRGDVGGSSGGDFFDSSDSGGGDFGGGDSGGGGDF